MTLHGSISWVDEIICAFVGTEGVEEGSDAPPRGGGGALGGFSQEMLQLGEHLLERLRSGLEGGRKNSLAPAARIARRIALPLWLPSGARRTPPAGGELSITTMSP
jgi:hypothetical protein